MPLTDTRIRNAKARERPYKVFDGGGLHLVVNSNGSRLWRLKYRIAGREKLLSLGSYPAVGLKAAREARETAKASLAAGNDPSIERKAAQLASRDAAANTFRVVGDEYLEKLRAEGRAESTLSKVEWLLGFAYADFGNRPIQEITPVIVLETLRKVEKRGRHETARRLRATISSVFRYAVASVRADNDPTWPLRDALIRSKATPRAAITDPRELGALLRAIDGFDGQPSTRAALTLIPILFPRPGELRYAQWDEFDFGERIWTIPASRTKMRRPHRVPLPRQAVAILEELREITGGCDLVFPSVRSVLRPISDNTLNAALRRLGYSKDEVTAHGFRATFSTLANESGLWHPDAIERALAHVESNDVRRAYARGEHWDERVRMAEWWADRLGALKIDASGVVVPIRTHAS